MPSPVDKYFKEVKKSNPGYSDEQAWATAWSIYCKHKNPGSPSCHKPTDEYLKKEAAAQPLLGFYNALLIQRVASKYMEAMSLPEDVESRLVEWRRDKDHLLDSVSQELAGVDDLLDEFKDIERGIRDRDLRRLITDDVHDADSLLKVVEDFGELGVVL
jgi:hypothetical protein